MFPKKTCIQFIKKQQNAKKALSSAGVTVEKVSKLNVRNYSLRHVPKEDRAALQDAYQFICDNEYLGKPHKRTTHVFAAYYKEHIAGVVTLSTPNAFSHILGKENMNLEKLISRGATSAIACKNLGSALNMYAINWMVANTSFRIYTGFSDPEAWELGSIYKAMNFIYLGKGFGTKLMLYDPSQPEKGWFSDREVRKRTTYKRLALRHGIEWQANWECKGKILWNNMPEKMVRTLRYLSKSYINSCQKRVPKSKAKWCLIKGIDKREERKLKKLFIKHNPKLVGMRAGGELGLPYPAESVRGI